jgi:ADP-dependent NAD(P)H-hydrate dehydratase / NAD(P)H-hydrate epimerase
MKIFSATQIREWDNYTIQNEPISSIVLMEKASRACFKRIKEISDPGKGFIVFAGPGNNGGDGFAIARMLADNQFKVRVFHFNTPTLSNDCQVNRGRWTGLRLPITDIMTPEDVPLDFEKGWIIIDAIFGTGHSRPLEGIYLLTCQAINKSGLPVISIDLPSGMYADKSSVGQQHIQAAFTLSLQCPKLCFFMPENRQSFGQIDILDIGLHPDFYEKTETVYQRLEIDDVKKILRPRDAFAHKGNFGQALLMAGSKGMMGASLLAARACLRSGAGKLFSAVPANALNIFQSAFPEAICIPDPDSDMLTRLPDNIDRFDAVGAGPGLGKNGPTRKLVKDLMTSGWPLVLDADALNIIAEDKLTALLPKGSIITPHIGEFTRLFGKAENDFERVSLAMEKAIELGIYIILKGRYTLIATPGGKGFFNTTGNPGMAKGGSGDVLTGIITGLLAASYSAGEACKLAVCLHGIAGDLARDRYSEHAMLASDIVEEIGPAFRQLS